MSLTTLFIVLSIASAGVCAGMAFTDWGRRRPLHRYGALSIGAHLMLLAGLACVRVGGPPSPGALVGPPVKVRIVREPNPLQDEAAPEKEPAQEAAPETPQVAARTPLESAPPIEPPQPLDKADGSPAEKPSEPLASKAAEPTPPEPAEQQAPTPTVDETAAPTSSAPDQAWSEAAEPVQVMTPKEVPVQEAENEVVENPPTAPIDTASPVAPIEPVSRGPQAVEATPPMAPSAYAQRGELAKRRLSADQGGTQETLDAVAAAVDWLARAQRRDGAWDAAQWGAGRETYTLDQDRMGAGAKAETGLTGLALLAMGGAGHSHLAGPYRDVVTKGLQFLLDQQEPSGDLGGEATLYARTYCHSMATFALAEAMAVTGDERLRPAVEAAVGYLVRGQSRAGGGWRYQPGDRGDMSQMGWAVMALRSAELAGVAIPATTWNGCEGFVASVRRGPNGGLAAYQPQGPVSSTMTAEAMYCRQILGVTRHGSRAEDDAVASLLTDLPGSRSGRSSPGGKANLYYWYYGTLALHHHRSTSGTAERSWRQWNDAMQHAILPQQVGQGAAAGSWGADTVWGGYGGRVYSTSLATMCLEVYYRYDADKIGRDPWLAAREGVLRR